MRERRDDDVLDARLFDFVEDGDLVFDRVTAQLADRALANRVVENKEVEILQAIQSLATELVDSVFHLTNLLVDDGGGGRGGIAHVQFESSYYWYAVAQAAFLYRASPHPGLNNNKVNLFCLSSMLTVSQSESGRVTMLRTHPWSFKLNIEHSRDVSNKP